MNQLRTKQLVLILPPISKQKPQLVLILPPISKQKPQLVLILPPISKQKPQLVLILPPISKQKPQLVLILPPISKQKPQLVLILPPISKQKPQLVLILPPISKQKPQLVLILPPISKQKLHGCRVFDHVWSTGKTSVQNPVHAHYLDFCHVEEAVVLTVASFHSLQGVVSLIKARAFQQTAHKTNKIINNTLAKLHRNNS